MLDKSKGANTVKGDVDGSNFQVSISTHKALFKGTEALKEIAKLRKSKDPNAVPFERSDGKVTIEADAAEFDDEYIEGAKVQSEVHETDGDTVGLKHDEKCNSRDESDKDDQVHDGQPATVSIEVQLEENIIVQRHDEK